MGFFQVQSNSRDADWPLEQETARTTASPAVMDRVGFGTGIGQVMTSGMVDAKKKKKNKLQLAREATEAPKTDRWPRWLVMFLMRFPMIGWFYCNCPAFLPSPWHGLVSTVLYLSQPSKVCVLRGRSSAVWGWLVLRDEKACEGL